MKTIQKELVEALERASLWVQAGDIDHHEFVEKYGGPEFPESSGNVEGWLDKEVRGPARAALERARREPEDEIIVECPRCNAQFAEKVTT